MIFGVRRTMSEDDFWALIAVMNGQADEDAVARLTDALRARKHKEVRAFQERLAKVLFELDREALADQPVRFTDDRLDRKPIPLSDDSFLYLRAGIVAGGRDLYNRVLANPAILAEGLWEDCEDLLYIADEIVGDDIDTAVSYETGSNEQHWSPRVEAEREEWDQGPRLVIVEFQDLSEPLDAEKVDADGNTEPFRWYLPPDYVDTAVQFDLTTTLAKAVTTAGGLPKQLGADCVEVIIQFGTWQLVPQVDEPVEDDEFHMGTVVRVRAVVAADVAEGWTEEVRRDALLAVGARCVMAVLPAEHGAHAELRRLYEQGAAHLPAE